MKLQRYVVYVITFSLAGTACALAGEQLTPPALTLVTARVAVSAAVQAARKRGAPGAAIAVVDAAGFPIALERLEGTFPAAPTISIGKARTAVMFHRPTRELEETVNKGRATMLALAEIAPFTPLQGGVPLVLRGQIVGAVGVSGTASAQQDDEIAQAAADAFGRGGDHAEVVYRPASEVEAAFAHNSRLIEQADYKIDTSRRDAGSWDAEVHVRDTDTIYVLSGNAEFVTGGELVDPHAVTDHELRGRSIHGGTTHHLSPGDVITVPRGTPHWFQRIAGSIRYYVVKVSDAGD